MKLDNKASIRAILLDDSQKSLEMLEMALVEFCPEVEIVGSFQQPSLAMKALREQKPDILFLDIEMPEISGFDFLALLGDNYDFEIIFCTAHENHILQALRKSAFDYLLKPIQFADLTSCIKRFQKHLETKQKDQLRSQTKEKASYILVSSSNDFIKVELADVTHVEADFGYTYFHLYDRQKIVVSKSMNQYQELLEEKLFFRAHKSYFINLDYLARIDKKNYNIILKNGASVPLAVRKKDILLEYLNNQSL